jgi:hypothetical protein
MHSPRSIAQAETDEGRLISQAVAAGLHLGIHCPMQFPQLMLQLSMLRHNDYI